jgi:hypothetical protein
MSSTSITTIGALIDERYRLYVCCEAASGGWQHSSAATIAAWPPISQANAGARAAG